MSQPRTKLLRGRLYIVSDRPTILLDLDGVCCDFIGGLCSALDKDREKIYNDPIWAEKDGYNRVGEVFGLTEKQLWDFIDRRGLSFWSALEPFPWFDEMHGQLRMIGNVVFLSSPSKDPFCVAGKVRWLQGIFGREFRNYIFTPLKSYFRSDNSLLIDDSEEMVNKFGLRHAVLFPQPWNSNRKYLPFNLDNFIETVKEKITFDLGNIEIGTPIEYKKENKDG